jgi:acyl dehydratase
MAITIKSEALTEHIGKRSGVSCWFAISRAQIDMFADASYDHQFINVDAKG